MPRTGKSVKSRKIRPRLNKNPIIEEESGSSGSSGSSSSESPVPKEGLKILSRFLGLSSESSSSKEEKKKPKRSVKAKPSTKAKPLVKATKKSPRFDEVEIPVPNDDEKIPEIYLKYSSFEIVGIIIQSLKTIPLEAVDHPLDSLGLVSAKTAKRASLLGSAPYIAKYVLIVTSACKTLDNLRTENKDQIMESIDILIKALENFLKELLDSQIDLERSIIDIWGTNDKYITEFKTKAHAALQIEIDRFKYILNEKIIRYFKEACS